MSTANTLDDPLAYRSIHTGAVLGVVLGVLSTLVLLTAGSSFETTLLLSPIPVIGLVASLVAWRAIAASPDVYTGAPLARLGAVLSGAFLALGVGYAGYTYATEVPDGYTRTSFLDLKPTETDLLASRIVPVDVQAYVESQEPVFIKGYIRPDSIRFTQNISDFLFVRDNQECCFGDLSKVQYFDQIKVNLAPGMTTDFSRKVFRLGGVLRCGPGDVAAGSPVTYYLDADYVR